MLTGLFLGFGYVSHGLHWGLRLESAGASLSPLESALIVAFWPLLLAILLVDYLNELLIWTAMIDIPGPGDVWRWLCSVVSSRTEGPSK